MNLEPFTIGKSINRAKPLPFIGKKKEKPPPLLLEYSCTRSRIACMVRYNVGYNPNLSRLVCRL